MIVPLMTVVLRIVEPPSPTTCNPPGPVLSRNDDNSYTRFFPQHLTLQQCYSKEQLYSEEWTDYPEKGGTFLRRIEQGKP